MTMSRHASGKTSCGTRRIRLGQSVTLGVHACVGIFKTTADGTRRRLIPEKRIASTVTTDATQRREHASRDGGKHELPTS